MQFRTLRTSSGFAWWFHASCTIIHFDNQLLDKQAVVFFLCLRLDCRKRRYIPNPHGGMALSFILRSIMCWIGKIFYEAHKHCFDVCDFFYKLFLCQEKRNPFRQSHILYAETIITYPKQVTLTFAFTMSIQEFLTLVSFKDFIMIYVWIFLVEIQYLCKVRYGFYWAHAS